MIAEKIKDRISNIEGKIGIFYMDIHSGKSCIVGNCDKFVAAGIVKLCVLIEAFSQIAKGKINKNDPYIVKDTDKVPSFGAINSLHEGTVLTIEDVYKLMIAVSDNTAVNVLINRLGMENINATMERYGFKETKINRLFFDYKKSKAGVNNFFSLQEISELLNRLYKGQIISNEASQEILGILKHQQRNNIIPYYFDLEMVIAHQSGFDPGIIHNVGIVYTENPFILCMGANEVDTRKVEGIMRDISLLCYNYSNQRN